MLILRLLLLTISFVEGQGLLDAQFLQLRQLQDESNPGFVGEVISLFFDDSEKLLNELTSAMYLLSLTFNILYKQAPSWMPTRSKMSTSSIVDGHML